MQRFNTLCITRLAEKHEAKDEMVKEDGRWKFSTVGFLPPLTKPNADFKPPEVGMAPSDTKKNPPRELTKEEKKAFAEQRLADEAAKLEREAAKKKADDEAAEAKRKADEAAAAKAAVDEAKKREATATAKLEIAKQLTNPELRDARNTKN